MPTVTVRVNSEQLDAAIANFPAELHKLAEAIMLEGLGELEQNVVELTPVAHGILAGSIFSELLPVGEGQLANGIVAVSPPADTYALPVETGRKPGRVPPMEAIMLWLDSPKMSDAVADFAADLRKARRAKGKKGSAADDQKEAERSLAFLIARKIGRDGTEGAHMFGMAFDENGETVQAHMTTRLETGVVQLLEGGASA